MNCNRRRAFSNDTATDNIGIGTDEKMKEKTQRKWQRADLNYRPKAYEGQSRI